MDFKYPKSQKLKSKKTIDILFSEGKTVVKYPLRLVFIENENQEENLKIGVSVSKKYFKKAVERNYFKRVLRECYRLNKHILIENIEKKYSIMFFYQTSEKLNYQDVNQKTIELFQVFLSSEKK